MAARFYRDVVEPLVVLEVEPGLLTSEVVDEVPAGADEAFPHVYGALDVTAVVAAHPVGRTAEGGFVLPGVVTGWAATDPST